MNAIDSARAQVEAADGLGPAFGALWDAFDVISLAAEGNAEKDTEWFLTWMALIPPACEGRDALGFAPSIQPGGRTAVGSDDLTRIPEDLAKRSAAELARACAAKLPELATVPVIADATAARRALVAAEEICEILRDDG